MSVTRKLHDLGQSIWLDNLSRGLLNTGALERYINDFSVTGITSNPTIFYHAIQNSRDYDEAIRRNWSPGRPVDSLREIVIEDIRQAADLLRPTYDATGGLDGWVSLEVSPLLADDAAATVAAAKRLYAAAERPNVFVKIPGTPAGLRAIEESVASLFVSRWDVAVRDKAPEPLVNRLGVNVARQTYETYRSLLDTPRWQRILDAGARPQRLLWASTGTKDPAASDIFYITSLIAPSTITTMPEATLRAFAEHGDVGHILPIHARYCDHTLDEFAKAGIDVEALGQQLQNEGVEAFAKSWNALMECISTKGESLRAETAGVSG